jgi:hypothetical protein
MELFLKIIYFLSATALILRGYVFFIIKVKAKDPYAKASFQIFLWKDFGKIDQILIWYMDLQKERTDVNKYIKILNFLTSVILVSLALSIIFFVIILFS